MSDSEVTGTQAGNTELTPKEAWALVTPARLVPVPRDEWDELRKSAEIKLHRIRGHLAIPTEADVEEARRLANQDYRGW